MLAQESIEAATLQAIRLSRKAMFKGISTPKRKIKHGKERNLLVDESANLG
jgi:hypothetical protein